MGSIIAQEAGEINLFYEELGSELKQYLILRDKGNYRKSFHSYFEKWSSAVILTKRIQFKKRVWANGGSVVANGAL